MDNRKFSFRIPSTNLIFGQDTLQLLGNTAKARGSCALLVCGKGSMKRLGYLSLAKESLESAGLKTVIYGGVSPNPTVDDVVCGIDEAISQDCDLIVALGGGSAIDCAKAIAVGTGHKDCDIWQYIRGESETTDKTLPIIAIPSTSGTGSHLTWYTVITNSQTQEKGAYSSEHIYPGDSIVDLEVLAKMPPKVTAETGFDALAHVMESYLSKGSSPITDVLALKAISLIAENLPRAYEYGEDLSARHAMALADSYAGICITSSRTIIVHAMGNTISGLYPNIAHGQALASITSACMKYNIEEGDARTISRYCDIAEAMGAEISERSRDSALLAVAMVDRLKQRIGLLKGLAELGVTEDSFPKMAEYSLGLGKGALAANPRRAEKEDIIDIYRESL